MAEKNSFVLMKYYLEEILFLSDDQAGKLIKSIYLLENGKDPLEMDQATTMLYLTIKRSIQACEDKYKETCRKRAENGKKGGRGNKANAFSEKQNKANKANAFLEKQKKHVDVDVDVDIDVNTTISPNGEVVVGAQVPYSPTNYEIKPSEIRNLQDEFSDELVNWGLKRMDDYLQRNPNKSYASPYQTVADWIRQEMVKREKKKSALAELDKASGEDWGEGELESCLSEIFINS